MVPIAISVSNLLTWHHHRHRHPRHLRLSSLRDYWCGLEVVGDLIHLCTSVPPKYTHTQYIHRYTHNYLKPYQIMQQHTHPHKEGPPLRCCSKFGAPFCLKLIMSTNANPLVPINTLFGGHTILCSIMPSTMHEIY